ncbi:hypothetical protein ABIB25_002639 [Nakamurella sp. UYEF19]|uniref:hypothetical protein n=1 Tax=Nakamurella sp. UYEF19 TaxID=1756392 RepID=UPI0033952228
MSIDGGGQRHRVDWGRSLLAGLNPGLSGQVGAFRRARAGVPSTARGRTVAVIGRLPGSGTSTVAALLALAAAGYTDNRVTVVETNRAGGRGRSVTELLGGSGDGRLPALLTVPDGEAVARRRVRSAGTPGAAVPVLALPADAGSFAPQVLEQTLTRLRHRADLTIIDTPSDRGEPVFHAVLHLVDQVVLVLTADRSAPARLDAARRWLSSAPGPARHHSVCVALVAVDRLVPRWRPGDLPWVLVPRDRALRNGLPGRMSRRALTAGLELVRTVSDVRRG